MADSEYDTRLDTGAAPPARLTMADKLGQAQSELDDAVGNGELQEGAYMRISNKFKECLDDSDGDVRRAKFNMFVSMTRVAPQLVGSPFGGIWPIGDTIMRTVTLAARTNKASTCWWFDALDAYVDAILNDSKSTASTETRLRAFINLADHLTCVEDKILSEVLFCKKICFMCQFTDDVNEKNLIGFAENVLLRSPYLILNVKKCGAHSKHGFASLKRLSRQQACKCLSKDVDFEKLVGPTEVRRSKRTRVEADSDEEMFREAWSDLRCAAAE